MRKIIKYAVFVVCSFIVLLGIITLMLPSEGHVENNININAQRKVVLHHLTDLKHYKSWFPWIQGDSGINIIYYDLSDGIPAGFSFLNQQKKQGNGKYELTRIEPDSILYFHFSYNDMPPIKGRYELHAFESGEQTTVVWKMDMKAGWKPWWRFFAAMMGKLATPVMNNGLEQLKAICEENQR